MPWPLHCSWGRTHHTRDRRGRSPPSPQARYRCPRFDEHVLRGCRLGRLVQDTEVASNDELRAPIQTMFVWIQQNIASTLEDGRSNGEIRPDANIEALAATILAVRQGAYVLARAAQSEEPFRKAADGLIEMLTHGVCV
ncbi:TetR family transcriptional regulator C-terminal domain-containing protein [Rhodococcus erythropolis]|uniref:TetR family transcriptional regulator C-terminal domain-containing protein n=1 Tax=Rhodococcus erythropolis TaxID=1833 RepID=UPI0024BAFA3B|nr:TetR family transcriptional regulator C-terminal domain-containing protein [Rhodococcus erythropolis]MDJ0403236.1 TetR family transcriptional regulator C-terminal domain-containing protein [Rhodococcus erythropolis]